MYFKLVNRSTKWSLKLASGQIIDLEQGEDGKISCTYDSFDFESVEQLLRAHPGASLSFIGPKEETYQLQTSDGDKYKVRREADGKLKLWGRTIKVTFFDEWSSVFSHFGEVFLKNIEAFEHPEYICTDSKGRYVATIRADAAASEWIVFVTEDEVLHRGKCLNEAFEHVLQSSTI